jgi:hypothetical protein
MMSTINIIVFTGPTLSVQEAQNILKATYLPPARQGDVLSVAYNEKPDVIAIIDSTVFFDMPVWHKEILYALKNGIAVYGASAVGAQRAVELREFGMIGVGQVYQSILRQELDDDSDVLVSFDSGNGYKKLSESFVNLRATFADALQHKIIRDEEYTQLLAIAKGIYYPQRTFANIFDQAIRQGLHHETIARLQQFVTNHFVDVQKRDAIELLQRLATLTTVESVQDKTPIGPCRHLFYALCDRDRRVRQDTLEFPRYYISNYVEVTHPAIEDINFHALNRKLVLLLANIFGIQATQEEIEQEKKRFTKKYGLTSPELLETWLKQNDLNQDDFFQLIHELAHVRKTQQWFVMNQGFRENTQVLLEELILRAEYPLWKEKTAYRETLIQGHDAEFKQLFNNESLLSLLKEHLRHQKFPWNIAVLDSLSETGMPLDNLKIELIKEKLAREHILSLAENLFSA